jgi:uncharacterized membrane protein
VEKPNRPLAFFAYLVPLLGPIVVLLVARKNLFALYHAYQALALLLIAALAPVAWAVAAWLVLWIPLAGGLLMGGLFALVVAAYLAILAAWIAGLINSLRGQLLPLPFFGSWGDRLFAWFGGAALQVVTR